MAAYTKVPWKRSLRTIPKGIIEEIRSTGTREFVVAAVRDVSITDIRSGLFAHLNLKEKGSRLSFESTVSPPSEMGLTSTRNNEGWVIKRTDLPKVLKTIPMGERPNFGDWSRGSHFSWVTREVYQTENIEPRDFKILVDVLVEPTTQNPGKVKFEIDYVLDSGDDGFEPQLLFCLNLLQENVGAHGVSPSGKRREDYFATIQLDWEVFPPGSLDAFAKSLKKILGRASPTNETIAERLRVFKTLDPKQWILGTGGLSRYFGAVIRPDLVVFENVRYGNALYVLYDTWESVSKRSRLDLIRGTDADYERIPHVEGWESHLRSVIRRGRPRARHR